MPITHHDLLEWAERQAEQPDEVSRRAAASRAYYAAFLPSEDLSKPIPEPEDAKGMHDRVIKKLLSSTEQHKVIGKLLSTIKSRRVMADYKIHENWTETQTKTVIENVKKVLSLLSSLPQRNAP
ncbi:MAG: hypothetical protein OEV94_04925 [Deltaproteobacteria bacterium]|nr:hypothetical protein [Deltaproteobacteria bacterium]